MGQLCEYWNIGITSGGFFWGKALNNKHTTNAFT